MNLLIVDDHPINLEVLRAQLEHEGHTVVEAANGVQALEVLERVKSVEGVVSDLLMPDMDGFRLCLEIRKSPTFAALPFIVCTSTYDSPADRQLAKTVGADHYFTKPVSVAALLGALQEAAQRTRPRIAALAARADESYVLKQYNASLVRKLEERNIELEGTLKNLHTAHNDLRQSESLKDAILRSSLDCLITIDHEGKIVEFNPAAATTFGYTREQVLGKVMVDLIVPPRHRDAHRRGFAHYLATGQGPILGRRIELEAMRADGTEFPIELTITAIRATSTPMFTGFIRDITAHKEADGKIRRLNRVYAVLSGINTLIVRVHDRDELFREACRIAVEQGNFGIAWIGDFDPATLDVTPVAWAGLGAKDYLGNTKSTARADVPQGQGAVGRAIRELRPVCINDLSSEPSAGSVRREEALARGYRSVIVLPLIVGGAAVGNLSLFAQEINFFDDEEVKLLAELAGNISFALENIGVQQRLDRLSRIRAVSGGISALIVRVRERRELLNEACRIAVKEGKFPFAWVGALDPVTQDVTPVAWAGESSEELTTAKSSARDDVQAGKGAVGRAIRERRPVFNNDLAAHGFGGPRLKEILKLGFRSQITLPLYVDQSVAGTLTMYAHEPDFFDEEELKLLTELAGDISFALENFGRQQKLDRLSRVRAVSSEVNAAILRTQDRQELLEATCIIAVGQAGFQLAWIGMIDPVTRDLKPAAMAGTVIDYAMLLAPSIHADTAAGQGTNGRAFREMKPVVDNDMSANPGAGFMRSEGLKRGIMAAVSIPLLMAGAPVGVIGLYSNEKDYFDDEEVALLTEVARNISFALENIARQQSLDKLARIRAVSSEINAVIIRIHDREALLRETCRIAVEHGKFELVWIGTVDAAKQQIQPVAWHGFSKEVAEKVSWASSRTAGGTLGEAIRTAKPAVRNDIETEMTSGGMRAEALKRGCLSTVCMPLVVDDEVVVLISIFAAGKGFFDENELILLKEVAADVSFALQGMEKQKKLEYLSYYDVLTSLPNRTLFHETLKKTLALATDRGWLVAVLCIDLDFFKNVNDTLGHAIGDELLRQFSNRLIQCVRIRDTVGRLGGDEFALILLMEDGKEGAAHVANKIREALRAPFDLAGHTVTVTASIGITIHPDDAPDPGTLMKYADTAMYRAKQAGRDTFRFFTAQMNTEVVARLDLEAALRKAIENGEFVLHYQPKVQLSSGRIAGVEALLRWQRPGHGLVPPNLFIPVLEETGLIVRVGSWVVATACRQIAQWMRTPIGPVPISVNVAGRQFIEGDLHGDVVKALGESGIAPDLLELELTESSLMANTELTVASLQNLHKLGVQISIDDFGTGYSSLAYLSRFPIHKLKIDIAFIRDVTSNPDHAAIVLAIIRMAHGLKLDVIAEGVETAAQLVYLRRHQCDSIQGYYFSRPLPLPELEKMLVEKKCVPATEAESGQPVKTLLLVDDDAGILALLERLLRNERYHILSARSAAEGFELLALHPVQVILCDQRMVPMTGTAFCGRVKDLYPDTFRIILSAYTDTDALMEAINSGAIHRFYTKPWDDKILRENILEAFRRHRLLHDASLSQRARDPGDTLPPRRIVKPLV